MSMLPLNLTLRGIALLLLLAVTFVYFDSGALHIKQFILANVLFLLSVFPAGSMKRLAIISAILSVVALFGTVQSYMEGSLSNWPSIIYAGAFVFLLVISAITLFQQYRRNR